MHSLQGRALEAIRDNPIFSGLAESDLEELVAGSRLRHATAGECLIATGDEGDALLVILDGEVEVHRETDDGDTPLATLGPGAFVGEMALIDNAPRSATVCATADSEILEITKAQFNRLLDQSPDAARAVIRTILSRLKSTEAMLVNQEKLAALGRVSAGLAHELNNPASAVSRFASHLSTSIAAWQEMTEVIASSSPGLPLHDLGERATRARQVISEAANAPLSPLEQANREDALASWLNARNVPNPWNLAATLTSAGFTVELLDQYAEGLQDSDIPSAVAWLSAKTAIDSSLTQLQISSARLSEIVGSVKRYSHMDRAAAERVDVNKALETTFVILRHKMRGIELILELDPDLPEIDGYPAELNQVWTNLIDNAIDAMSGSGTLIVRTWVAESNVVVEIRDSGPGIAPEHKRRLFEPFFTTKAIGAGTGLGLHIAHNIVVHRHRGTISVDSQPGATSFTVSLPIRR